MTAGRIQTEQKDLLTAYYRDPQGAMKAFLQAHPEYLRRALGASDERTAGRARMLVEQNPYGLDLTGLPA